jgi:hypothetical protein
VKQEESESFEWVGERRGTRRSSSFDSETIGRLACVRWSGTASRVDEVMVLR